MPFTTGDLRVDLPALDLFARRLDVMVDTMVDTPSRVNAVDDHLGHSGASDALHAFVKGWRDGRGKLEREMNALAKMGHSVVQTLTETDINLKNAVSNGKKNSP
jgi:hypothetical protein